MKKKNLIRIGLLSTLLLAGIGSIVFINATPLKAEAAQFLDDYDPYSYTGHYYDDINFSAGDGEDGALRKALTALIKPKGYYSYSGSGSTTISYALQYADEDPNNSSNMIYLYTRNSVAKNAASSWNREHVWCQSLSNGNWGKSQGGTDVLHLRPTYNSTNSSRSNAPYGEVDKKYKKEYNGMLYGYCENNNIAFMPIDQVKGDVARTVMYLWTTYNNTSKPLSITTIFESYDTLLRWHTNDRPDELEGNRNDWVEQESKQKNRNPFVDHPELAWKIFGDKVSSSVKEACMAIYPEHGSVGPVDPTGITINKESASVKVNDTVQLVATLKPNGATGTINWSSDDEDVATVNNNGVVTGVSEGTCTITAKYSESIKVTCDITVTANSGGNDGELSLADSIQVGDTVYLTCNSTSNQFAGPSNNTTSSIGTYVSFADEPDVDTCPLEVCEGNQNATFAFKIKSGTYENNYLAYTSTGNNLNITDEIADNSSWNVSFDSEKNVAITNYGSSNREIKWNNSSPRFCCYANTFTGAKVQLWKISSSGEEVFNLENSLKSFGSISTIHATETHNQEVGTATYDLSQMDLTNGSAIENLKLGAVNVNGDKGTNGSNSPKFYTSDNTIRLYQGNKLTFESDTDITKIKFTFSAGEDGLTASKGTLTNGVWTGSTKSVTFTNSYSTNTQIRFTALEITGGLVSSTSVSEVALRFGAEVPSTVWDKIAENCEINDYGVILVKQSTLVNTYSCLTVQQAFEAEYNLAIVSKGSGEQPSLVGNKYLFQAKINVSNYETVFCALPFIVIDNTYHFLTEKRYSAKTLAEYYLENGGSELSNEALTIISNNNN